MKIAILDIGSNSIRYMEAEDDSGSVRFSEKQTYTTRLAEDLLRSGMLSEAAMARSLSVIGDLAEAAGHAGTPVYAYATNAVRDAGNREAFCAAVAERTGRQPDVLSGEREARLAYLAAADGAGGFLEIGGGSTQVVGEYYCRSFPLGCVKARDVCPGQTLSEIRSGLVPALDAVFTGLPAFSASWTGAGGTITTLCALCLGLPAYDPARVQGAALTADAVAALLDRLSRMGDAARAAMPLLRRRHDVILHGGVLLLYLLDRLGADRLTVSDTDGMEGYAVQTLHNTRHNGGKTTPGA